MNIGIVGGGAIGLLFGSYLTKNDNVVTLYTRTKEQAILLQEKGILLHRDNISVSNIEAIWINEGMVDHDLLIITVKQYQLATITPLLYSLSSTTPLLFVQNGMGHLDLLKGLPQTNIMVGVVEHGALRIDHNNVLHSGAGITRVSVFNGELRIAEEFIKSCSSTFFPIEKNENWYNMLIAKLVVNSMINPLTALLRVVNGQLISNPHFYQLFTRLYQEIIALLKPENPNEWWDSVLLICQKTANNRSSMLRDIEQSKTTEIEGILGYYHSLPSYPVTDTPLLDFLYNALKGLEN
jgi:2-dehydropantoate 2-reductase